MIKIAISFVAGVLMVGAFEPFAWSWLSFISLAILFYLWQSANPKTCFWLGWSYGLGLFAVGVSWVYMSLHTYGGMPLWMGSIAVFLFAAVLALYIGLQGYLVARLFAAGSYHRLLAMPWVWIIFEWLKSWLLTGFPWLELGYSQSNTWLFGLAPIGGVYLVSLFIAQLAILAILVLKQRYRTVAIISTVVICVSSWMLNMLSWSTDSGKALTVTVVQGNIAIDKKWQPSVRDKVIRQYASLTQQANQQQKADLIVWPETALPLFIQQTDLNAWQAVIPDNSALLVGILDQPAPKQNYNAALLICDNQQQIYRKRHLVPFGEYLPLRSLFGWVLDYLQLPMSDLSAWRGVQPLSCQGNINIGLSICYEDAFANEHRKSIGESTMLINISEDAWFGDSFAPHQRLQMAQMRARELGRPLVRSANTGPSVFIDERGQVVKQSEQFVAQTLTHKVQPKTGKTPFHRWGNWVIYLSLLVLTIFKLVSFKKANYFFKTR